MSSRKNWHTMVADAHALLDAAEALRGKAQHHYVVAAAQLVVDAACVDEPRDRSVRARWEREVDRAERRVAPFGCAGCLAMDEQLSKAKHRAAIKKSPSRATPLPPDPSMVHSYVWPITTKTRRIAILADPLSRGLLRDGDLLHRLGLCVSLTADPDGSRQLRAWTEPPGWNVTSRRKITNPYYRRPPRGWRPAAPSPTLDKRVCKILMADHNIGGRIVRDSQHSEWTLYVPAPPHKKRGRP